SLFQVWLANRSCGAAKTGAGERNRTVVISLEGCCSTIELHPQSSCMSAHLACSSCYLSPLTRASGRPIALSTIQDTRCFRPYFNLTQEKPHLACNASTPVANPPARSQTADARDLQPNGCFSAAPQGWDIPRSRSEKPWLCSAAGLPAMSPGSG